MLKEESNKIIITSCCHSINLLIQKYYPVALQYLADVMSPMQAHCQDIKRSFMEKTRKNAPENQVHSPAVCKYLKSSITLSV